VEPERVAHGPAGRRRKRDQGGFQHLNCPQFSTLSSKLLPLVVFSLILIRCVCPGEKVRFRAPKGHQDSAWGFNPRNHLPNAIRPERASVSRGIVPH